MLQVKTPEETWELIIREFDRFTDRTERVPFTEAAGRILAENICAQEYVPGFDRSTVDGYALRASDTFGCSESIPAILTVTHEVLMGESAEFELKKGSCAAIPTGGALPSGADCTVMIEYTEDYGDGTIGVMKAGAPGENVIFKGDDVYPGKTVLEKGRKITPADIGAFAAMGICDVPVVPRLKVGILSTGDELIPPEEIPLEGQIRDVNSGMLAALFACWGAEVVQYGIIRDEKELLLETVRSALQECDALVISGGSSVGTRDAAAYCIESVGEILLHGIAIKPGKPTLLGKAGKKPVIGLPGHPAAAWFIARLFVLPIFDRLSGCAEETYTLQAVLDENISANHGRAQVCACTLEKKDGVLVAHPVHSKSGLITQLTRTDGFFVIDRDCEGLAKGAKIQVIRYGEV